MSDITAHDRILDGYADENEVAAEFNINKKTLRNWRRLRKGPPWVKAPGGVIYPIEQAREWLRKKTQI